MIALAIQLMWMTEEDIFNEFDYGGGWKRCWMHYHFDYPEGGTQAFRYIADDLPEETRQAFEKGLRRQPNTCATFTPTVEKSLCVSGRATHRLLRKGGRFVY